MDRKLFILIIILFVLLIILLYISNSSNNDIINNKISWCRNKCSFDNNETHLNIFKKYNIDENNSDSANLFLPCSYDDIDKEISQMPVKSKSNYYLINNCDELVAKERLWKYILAYHKLDKSKKMMPMSYILYNDDDLKKFKLEYEQNKLYIIKKNIQRQEGLKITNNFDDIVNGKNNSYVICQELLQNPYLINGRKINMRFYVLYIRTDNNVKVYVYNDGFMYYTKNLFKKNSLNIDNNITTGYIDRKVYETNPLTHKDFANYLGNVESKIFYNKVNDLFKDIFLAYTSVLTIPDKFKNKNNVFFQLFGADIAVDENLDPMIMEMNKGPDLGAKDERDSEIKHNVVRDIMRLINAINNVKDDNGFVLILDKNA